MDTKSFFRSIDKKILWNIVQSKINQQDRPDWWKMEVLWLTDIIISHNQTSNYVFKGKLDTKNLIPKHKSLLYGNTDTGLPIGNLTSQFFANIYLNTLDIYIEKVLGYEQYSRYVDDFVLFDEDKEKLRRDMQNISLFCSENLNLQIATHKTILRNSNIGIDFLGYYIKPTHTLVRRKVVQRFRYKFYRVLDENGFVDIADISMIRSYMGHFGWADSWGLYKKYRLI